MQKQNVALRLFFMRKLSPHIVPLLATLCAAVVLVSVSGHPVYLGKTGFQPKNAPSEKHATQIRAKDKTQHIQPEKQRKTEENTEKHNKNRHNAQENPEKPSPKEKDSQYGEFFSLKLPPPSFSFQPTAYLPKDSPKHTYSPPLRIRKAAPLAFLYALIPFRQILFTHYKASNAP